MRKKFYPLIFLCGLLLTGTIGLLQKVQPVSAAAGSAADLIAAVNADRAAHGLAAYTVNSTLMGLAQAQSDYQASINNGTHSRADGTGPGDHGIAAENVAYGPGLSVNDAIYSQWTDTLHMGTLLGPTTGVVGAGVATSNGVVYYTLDVNNLTGDFTYPKDNTSTDTVNATLDASIPTVIYTSTPNSDGSVKHTIVYGETLIEIAQAYSVPLSQIYTNNPSIDENNPIIVVGQVLIIRPSNTPTPVMSPTNTPHPPTRTSRPTRTATEVRTPTIYPTATATVVSPTPRTSMLTLTNRSAGYGIILICAAGLIFVIFKWFVNAK